MEMTPSRERNLIFGSFVTVGVSIVFNPRRTIMSKQLETEVISRRKIFSLLGLAAGASVAMPLMSLSAAQAQTSGMERRDDRRDNRQDRRDDRQTDRSDRRDERKNGTTATTTPAPTTTPPAKPAQ